jgi:hypothetical protein
MTEFTVWHLNSKKLPNDVDAFWFGREASYRGLAKALFDRIYVKVATVEASDLEDVFKLSNSISGYWCENEGVVVLNPDAMGYGGNRSTSVGDVIEYDDRFFMVESFGFEEII